MARMKGCPKCGGYLFPEHHLSGVVDIVCLQCGKILTPRELTVLLLAIRGRQATVAASKAVSRELEPAR